MHSQLPRFLVVYLAIQLSGLQICRNKVELSIVLSEVTMEAEAGITKIGQR